jgi:hypothetical protein
VPSVAVPLSPTTTEVDAADVPLSVNVYVRLVTPSSLTLEGDTLIDTEGEASSSLIVPVPLLSFIVKVYVSELSSIVSFVLVNVMVNELTPEGTVNVPLESDTPFEKDGVVL